MARDSAKAVHADYDTSVLDRLLSLFKIGMGRNDRGEEFNISIANTDDDTRERTALSNNWPNILLLLCTFHIWQAWRNGLNQFLCCIPKGDDRQSVRQRLGKFLVRLVKEISAYEEATAAYRSEILYWKSARTSQRKGALAFLKYLKGYLSNVAMWQAWSPAGAIEASQRLGLPLSRVAQTNNHLELFNGRLKGKYYKPYQHSGRLPRIDVWILLIVTHVMPDFFQEQRERQELSDYYATLHVLHPDHEPVPPGMASPSTPDIKIWINELENDLAEDGSLDEEEMDDLTDEDPIDADRLLCLSTTDSKEELSEPDDDRFVSTSMDYTEKSIHPDEYLYQVCEHQLFF